MQSNISQSLRHPARLSALRRLGMLDTPGEEAFDRLIRLATRVLDVPIAIVLFIEEDREYFKSMRGVPEPWATTREYPVCDSVCQYMLDRAEPLVIEDMRKDPLLSEQRMVSDFGIVGYIGVPLITDGHVIGTFCVFTREPRAWREDDVQLLVDLAASAMTEIDLRALAQEAQRQQEERSTILERITDGFFALDNDWRFTYVNNRVEQLTQLQRKEVLGREFWEMFPETIGTDLEQMYRQAVREQTPVDFEVYYPPFNRWFNIHAYPSPNGLSVYYEDMTERKRYEELLNGQIRLLEMVAIGGELQEILEALVLMIEEQADGMICSILLVDKTGALREGAAPSLPPAYREALDGVMIGPNFGPCAMAAHRREKVILPDITELSRWTQFRDLALSYNLQACWSSPILAGNGQILGTFASYYNEPRTPSEWENDLIDVATHIAGIAIARARSEEMLRFLGEASMAVATSLDYDTVIQDLAETMVSHFADWCIVDTVEEDGSIHRMAVATTDPEKRWVLDEIQQQYPPYENTSSPATRVLQSREPVLVEATTEDWLRMTAVDAKHLELLRKLEPRSVIAVPLLSRGAVLGAITLVLTVPGNRYTPSDLMLAQELALRAATAIENARLYRQVQLALRARDQFLSVAAHELKTPITSLLGYAHLIERRAMREDERDEGDERNLRPVHALTEQAQRLHRLSTLLLDLSQIQSGALEIECKPLDLVTLVQQVVKDVQLTLTRHRIEMKIDGELLIVLGDEVRLEQALYNLIQNAVKYSPDGGTIEVGLWREDDRVSLSITDYGIGIPDDAMPNLFDRFFRADNVNPKEFSGMGLGLFVVKEIIDRHNGSLDVDSVEGEGSTFTIRLPRTSPVQ